MIQINSIIRLVLLAGLCVSSITHAQTRGQINTALRQANPNAPFQQVMDTGPFAADTFRLFTKTGPVAALKGVAIKIGDDEQASVLFDTELLTMRAGFIGATTKSGTPWDGGHASNTHTPAATDTNYFFVNATGLGWAIDGDFSDPRKTNHGPLPKNIARYRGLYRHANRIVLDYTVANTRILESPVFVESKNGTAIKRAFDLSDVGRTLTLVVSNTPDQDGPNVADVKHRIDGAPAGVELVIEAGRTLLRIAAGTKACQFNLVYHRGADSNAAVRVGELDSLTRGGPGIYPEKVKVAGKVGSTTQPYTVDSISLPVNNPWGANTRFGGFDFFADGKRAACSTWNGDVWIVDGIDGDLRELTWTRYASGLFQTLGLKIVNDVIYTQGRDQITRLHDLNNDGEADFYECFNNDVQITEGFHEFSFGLQTDAAGNFYFVKAMPVQGGGRGFSPWTEHNGCVLKVTPDGEKMTVVAWGLRAPGGLAVSPDGVITTGENEGSYVPQCKISWNPPGKLTFNGVVPSKWDGRDHLGTLPGAPTDYDRPLCWLPYAADNSGGGQVWVPENTQWDPRHAGQLLHLSYGKSTIYRTLREEIDGQVQGGVYRLPIDVRAATMRARFNPVNGDLYVMGFRGWQTNGADAFERIRFTGETTPQPVGLHAYKNGMVVKFSSKLDPAAAEDPSRYSVSKWDYVWGPQYGSGRFSIDHRDDAAREKALSVPSKGAHNIIDTVNVAAAKLLDDGQSVFLYMPTMTAAMQMEIKMDLADARGVSFRETIYNSVYKMRDAFKLPGVNFDDIVVVDTAPRGEMGLVMSFGGVITDYAVTPQLALNCEPGQSPSAFIGANDFEATWQGTLYMPERDEIVFSMEGAGHAQLRVGGEVILDGELPLIASVPMTLAKGGQGIFCSYKSLDKGAGRVRLMWSGRNFGVEPVPASVLRYIPSGEVEHWQKLRKGREVFAEKGCVKCHEVKGGPKEMRMPELREQAPDFVGIGSRLEPAFVVNWVKGGIGVAKGGCPTVAPEKATDIAAYLATVEGKGAAKLPVVVIDPNDASAGSALVEKLNLGPWVDVLKSERRHTATGLVEFLKAPAMHHRDTKFPDVRLSDAEAREIAAYVLMDWPSGDDRATGRGNVGRGRAAVAEHCVVCHDPKKNVYGSVVEFDAIKKSDWSLNGCVAGERGNAGGGPELRLTDEERTALLAFRYADRDVGIKSMKYFAPAEYAQRQMAKLKCLECHSGKNKLPVLTYAGEKFETEWLTTLLEGGHAVKSRSWLEARMPAFASRAEELAIGLGAMQGVGDEVDEVSVGGSGIALGGTLADVEGGYACVTCHDAGSRKALQVFEGQGPNLELAGERLRYDYYQRWLHNPRRIEPTTIMPQYLQPNGKALLENHLEGDARKQFEAIWGWMRGLGE